MARGEAVRVGGLCAYQGADEDGPDTLAGLVEAREEANPFKGPARCPIAKSLVVVSVGRQCNDGAVESFEAELVDHDACDVDCNVAAFLGREGPQAGPQVGEVSHADTGTASKAGKELG